MALKKFIRLSALVLFGFMILVWNALAVEASVTVTFDAPYYLVEKRDFVATGERFQARIVLESNATQLVNGEAVIVLPRGINPSNLDKSWHAEQDSEGRWALHKPVSLAAGYGQWFDLLSLQISNDAIPGMYSVQAGLAGTDLYSAMLAVCAGEQSEAAVVRDVVIDKVEMPLDKDGKKDERLQDKSLVLRDGQMDYVRNLLQGKGASNLQAEAVHPLAYIGIDISNSAHVETMVTMNAFLLDYHTKEKVPGLVTPAATGEEASTDSSAAVNREGSQAMAALSGFPKQRLLVPIYAEEQRLAGGKYWLHVDLLEENGAILSFDTPVVVVKKNRQALAVTCLGIVAVGLAFAGFSTRLKRQLHFMKTRWLITISLFSTATFAMVNVPSTLIGDFLHVILGPFSFLVTGLFNGVILYMLLVSLLMLIPYNGVVSLYMLIRLLLNVFAFGHLSVLTLLSYSLQAISLEAGFFLFQKTAFSKRHPSTVAEIVRTFAPLAMIFGVADACSTYVNMQAMTIFYRLYYADWYIFLVVLFNGVLFTVVGVFCGAVLGRQVQKIKGD